MHLDINALDPVIALAAATVLSALAGCAGDDAGPASPGGEREPWPGMQAYRWANRPLLIFAPSDDDPRLVRQRRPLADRAKGVAERDMVLIEVTGNRVTQDGRQVGGPKTIAELRQQYDVSAEDFWVILVGKDGTAKLRRETPVGADELFERIDSMPMRRREMRHPPSER